MLFPVTSPSSVTSDLQRVRASERASETGEERESFIKNFESECHSAHAVVLAFQPLHLGYGTGCEPPPLDWGGRRFYDGVHPAPSLQACASPLKA
jgi:hypothetical protein